MMITAQAQALEIKAKLFRGLSDASRLAILESLREGPLSVTEIVKASGLTQSNASNHLGCLDVPSDDGSKVISFCVTLSEFPCVGLRLFWDWLLQQ